jgi:amino acid transporter
VPSLQPHTLALCLGVLAILTIVNMRGVHDTGVVFMIPTYLFTATLLIVIAVGAWQVVHAAGHPHPGDAAAHCRRLRRGELVAAAEGFLFRMHGDDRRGGGEQRRDGLPRPTRKNAKNADHHHRAAGGLLAGIALLCRAYGIAATDPGGRATRACCRC